jgi:hypothetical protein
MIAKFNAKQTKLVLQIVCMLSRDPRCRTMAFALRAMAQFTRNDIFRRDPIFIDTFAICRTRAWFGTGLPMQSDGGKSSGPSFGYNAGPNRTGARI